ncbi:MAG: hypothetical protein IPM97_04970 [Bdellovibrionaceae bacterium]|nr:hypothetical protein [Pseudobdellovibrionaceae bacterium]
MRSYPKNVAKQDYQEKHLIAAQPARIILSLGLVLSLIIGFSIRGMIAPNKVKSMIESAASKIHKDVSVTFESASLSLRQGLFPRFAIIIQQVQMESSNECWMKPRLRANEIRLPLSLWAILQGQNPISQVEAGKVQIDFLSEYKTCEEPISRPEQIAPKIKQFVTLKGSAQPFSRSAENTPQVSAILIEELNIHSPALAEPLEMSAFTIRLKSNSPRVVQMSAKTHLIKDDQVKGEYLSHAIILGEYSEFPKKSLKATLSGNWREGSYQLKANYHLKEDDLSTEMEIKHIPVNQVFQVFKKMNWLKTDLNARQVWVSLVAQMSAKKSEIKKAGVLIRGLRLEGDLGDVTSSEIKVRSLEPFEFSPFVLEIQRLSLAKMLSLVNRSNPSGALGDLGKFTGTAYFQDRDHVEISGVHRGLEFIFSNKGQREVQRLKEVAGEMILKKDRWVLDVSRFTPEMGAFDGNISLQTDRDFKILDVKAKSKHFTLSPAVVKLMTSGGRVGPFSGDVQLKLQDGKMNLLKGYLASESGDIEGVEFEKLKFQFDYLSDEVVSQTQIQKLAIKVGSPGFKVIKELIEPVWMRDGYLLLKNVSSQLRSRDLKTLTWKGFHAQTEVPNGRVSSDGAWNSEGYLSGQIITSFGKESHKWLLGGVRDAPLFSLQDGERKKFE